MIDEATAIPVTLVGGYLGAGKTTLVNHLLRHREGRRIAVLVNDFGELPIDAELIEARDGELLQLAGGCVCCSFGDDLMAALLRLRTMQPAPGHVVVETSGVALPGSVARAITLVQGLVLDAVLVLADAGTLRERAADSHVGDTVRRQLAEADLVLLNKIDLVDAGAREALPTWLRGVAAAACVLPCEHARVDIALLLGLELGGARGGAVAEGQRALRLPVFDDAAARFASLGLEFEHAVDARQLAGALANPALRLLRAKGLLRDADGTPMCLQLAGARATLAPSAHSRPDTGRLVCIGLRDEFDAHGVRAAVQAAAR